MRHKDAETQRHGEEKKKFIKISSLCLCVSVSLCFVFVAWSATTSDPAQAVRDYYAAVAKHDCAAAIKLRPDYTYDRCRETAQVSLTSAETKYNQDAAAVVYLEVSYQLSGKPKQFKGYVKLTQAGGSWIIAGPFEEEKKGGLDAYLNNHVTGAKSKTDNADLYYSYHTSPNDSVPLEEISGLSFGSSAILHACWTGAQLEGGPDDKKVIGNDPRTNGSDPARLVPQNKLAPLKPERQNNIRSVKPNAMRKVVALTFDLCERSPETTGYDNAIVNYLRANQVRATFFAGGKWMRSHPGKAQQLMADPLFELGNHGWTHGNVRVMDGATMKEQIDWTQAQYELLREDLVAKPCAQKAGPAELNRVPASLTLFRPPYGACDEKSLSYLAQSGIATIQWSVVTGDPAKESTPDGIAKIVLAEIKPGAIVIMHANGRGHGTADALPKFIPELHRQGYQFVTVSELLALGTPYAPTECYEKNPGDNLVYDRKFGDGTGSNPGH
jgi:peptidoglycan-N-acetylglucosamine deacetylase